MPQYQPAIDIFVERKYFLSAILCICGRLMVCDSLTSSVTVDVMDHTDESTVAAVSDELSSVYVGRRRAQSCTSRHTLPSPTTSSVHRSALGSPGPPGRASSSRHGVVRRLSPAAVEAARLAIAARQAYARRESSRSMGETALFIVTNEAGGGQQTLDEQDVALLLQEGNRSRRSSRPGTPGSRPGHFPDAGTPHSPTTPFSAMSSTVSSPKHTAATNNSVSGAGRKRKSSRGSVTSQVLITVESPMSTTPGGGSKRPSTGSFRPLGTTTPTAGSRKASCYSTTSALTAGNGFPTSGSAVSKSALPVCTSTTALTASQPTRSPAKFAVAGVAMLAGTSALLLTYILGGSRWTLVGSTVMGIGSLMIVMAICWYLANTPGDQDDERRRCESAVQIHVVDERHLARLIKQGACVKSVGVV